MSRKNLFWHIALTVLGVACFPVNPLVLTGLVEPGYNRTAHIIGWFVWAFGMVLVLTPIIMFPRRGGVAKGKSFVHTTKLVNTGIYSIVRHPQYLGGIFALFITTLLWYPHPLFAVLCVVGITVLYGSALLEDRELTARFGEEYKTYMKKVPRMNIILGIIRRTVKKR